MKKYLLVIVYLFISSTAVIYAQNKDLNIPIVNDKILYQDTVSIKGLSKEQLYTKAKQWLVDEFVDYKAVIQTEDFHDGHLSAKSLTYIRTTTLGIGRKFSDEFTIQLDFKDGKYRCKIYDFYVSPTDQTFSKRYNLIDFYDKLIGKKSVAFSKGQCRDLVLDNDSQMKKLIISLKTAMEANSDF